MTFEQACVTGFFVFLVVCYVASMFMKPCDDGCLHTRRER